MTGLDFECWLTHKFSFAKNKNLKGRSSMEKQIIFVGLDVDSKAIHGSFFEPDSGEVLEFSCKPTASALITIFKNRQRKGITLKICYEAGYFGFSLQRELRAAKFDCAVISPNHIPIKYGAKVKTDRLDATKLAIYLAKGLLTEIHAPTEEQEGNRDLLRARRFLMEQASSLKRYIISICKRAGMDYRREEQNSSAHYWSARHRQWLRGAIGKLSSESWTFTLNGLLMTLDHLESQVQFYDAEIKKLAMTSTYHKGHQALICYRGIDTTVAMTLMTELISAKRFSHPNKITSFAGMDIKEYSSGGKEKKTGLTKMGNSHIRRAIIESCQYAWSVPKISPPLRRRRESVPQNLIEISTRCMNRLHKKSNRLLHKGKNKNKVKVACARETLGFVWESLKTVGF
jgi:transposase